MYIYIYVYILNDITYVNNITMFTSDVYKKVHKFIHHNISFITLHVRLSDYTRTSTVAIESTRR